VRTRNSWRSMANEPLPRIEADNGCIGASTAGGARRRVRIDRGPWVGSNPKDSSI